MTPPALCSALAGALMMATACTAQPSGAAPDPVVAGAPPVVAALPPVPKPVVAPVAPAAPPSPPAGTASDHPPPEKAPPLTPEEIALIEADPKSLSPEDRRRRAYALRKKIMQNPDSPAARTLEDLRRAAEAGELPPPQIGANKGATLKLEAPSASKPPGPDQK